MNRRLAALLSLVLLLLGTPSHAERSRILPSQSITTAGGAVSVTIGHAGIRSAPAYLVINTSDEVATASLIVTANLAHQFAGTNTLCTSAVITVATTTVVLIGSPATASAGVVTVCPFPLADSTTFTFTVTGAGAGFTVAADLLSP